jgi:mannose-6-phosphate isomerase-like protein (cupin superfamily)
VAGFDVVDVSDLEGEGPGGVVRKTRRALGARAFGFNYFVFPPNQEGREHDHSGNGQEEVYFVVKGSGTMRIDGTEVDLRPGRLIRVDPDSTRMPTSGPDGLEFITFGAPIDGAYEPPEWG